jgi:hypothetical protein
MSESVKTIDNHEAQRLDAKTHDSFKPLLPCSIFLLCNTCLWYATYFDKNRLPHENTCALCETNNQELSSFPIMPNESFSFIYDVKRGLEIEFKHR